MLKGGLWSRLVVLSVPPFLIFPRVNFKDHMLHGTPPGSARSATKNGWSNSDIFMEILNHFKNATRCTKETPVILYMDNHESHISIDSLNFCKDNGIEVVTFPPHTTDRLHPLDKCVYKSLKNYYNAECYNWLICNPGKTISIYEVGALFGKAYEKAFNPSNITSSFRSTGIWPINPDIFTEEDFLSFYVSDRPLPYLATETNESAPESAIATTTSSSQIVSTEAKPSVSAESPAFMVSPQDIRPHPKAVPGKTKGRKRGISLFATDSPVKEELIRNLEVRTKKTKGVKKKLVEESEEEEEEVALSLADSYRG